MESKKSKILVVGLGNPNLGDDGVGWMVAEEVKRRLPPDQSAVDVVCLSLGGLSLMEHLIGYGCVILVDAFALEEPIGSILMLKLSDLPSYSAFHTASAHDVPLQTAIKLGKSMGAQLPDETIVVGIVTKRVSVFSRELSTPIAVAAHQAVKFVMDFLGEKMQIDGKSS